MQLASPTNLLIGLCSPPNPKQVCAVCGEGHSEDGNQIVFCDQCDLAVHQGCYGVDLIPDKEW